MKKIKDTKIKGIFPLNVNLYFCELIKSTKYAFSSLIFFSILASSFRNDFVMIFRNFRFKSRKIISSSLSNQPILQSHFLYVIQHKFNIV